MLAYKTPIKRRIQTGPGQIAAMTSVTRAPSLKTRLDYQNGRRIFAPIIADLRG